MTLAAYVNRCSGTWFRSYWYPVYTKDIRLLLILPSVAYAALGWISEFNNQPSNPYGSAGSIKGPSKHYERLNVADLSDISLCHISIWRYDNAVSKSHAVFLYQLKGVASGNLKLPGLCRVLSRVVTFMMLPKVLGMLQYIYMFTYVLMGGNL